MKLTRVTFDECDNVRTHVKQKQSYNNREQINQEGYVTYTQMH